MEVIGTGILLAIGFYVAPLVVGFVIMAFMGVLGFIGCLFSRDC